MMSRRASWFLVAVGVWTWLIWPRFLKAIWDDDRAWSGAHGRSSPTSFLLVHLVLVVVSLVIGTAVGWLGVRGVRALRRPAEPRVRVGHDGHDDRSAYREGASTARPRDGRF